MSKKTRFLLALLPAFVACSNKGVYDSIQSAKIFECQQLPESEQAACREQAEISYEDYERSRQEALEN